MCKRAEQSPAVHKIEMIPDPGNVQIVQRLQSDVVGQSETRCARISIAVRPVEYPNPIALGPAYAPNHVSLQGSVPRHPE